MKRLTILLPICTLILTACLGSDSSCENIVSIGKLNLCVPAEWEQVPDEQLREEGVPEETMAAFQLKTDRDGQRDNVVVTRERVASSVTSLKFANANARIVATTPEYTEVEQRSVKIDVEETLLHIFSARPVPDLPVRRFYQVSVVYGTTGYVVTGTLPFSVEESIEEGLIEMLLSVGGEG